MEWQCRTGEARCPAQNWATRKAANRNDKLTSYDALKAERDTGVEDNKVSVERQKTLESQLIKSLQEEMRLDRHRTDLQEQVNAVRKDVEDERSLRRDWNLRREEITKELEQLKKGGLAEVRVNGRRPGERPSDDMITSVSPPAVQGIRADTNAANADLQPFDAGDQDANLDFGLDYESLTLWYNNQLIG
ncbi:hypothetical protein FB451DRAFT_1186343 [Mycena latifolia]|nr:hypothetical protein FB451DRAFT_1186343 [Mycena latifolia]